MTHKERFKKIIAYFQENMPEAETELQHSNPFGLLVAVILSAQCTDKRVNMITPGLMEKYPDAASMARATPEDIYPYIKSCSFPNNKSKHLVGMARTIMNKFKGEIPSDSKNLEKLPGVGRKTANVISSIVYNRPALAVDTHVFRVAARLGLTQGAKTPLETEKQLIEHIPEDLLSIAHHWLILHGRYVCKARRPLCEKCGLTSWCKYYQDNNNLAQN